MTTELDRALSAVNGYTEARAALDKLMTHIGSLKPVDSDAAERAVKDEARALALAGKPLPDDLGARLVAARGSTDNYAAERAFLHDLRQGLHRAVDETIRDGADDALRALARHMDALFADVRKAEAELGGAGTERDIMRRGGKAVDAYNRLNDDRLTYLRIREAQRDVVKVAFGGTLRYGESIVPASRSSSEATRLLQFVGEFKNPFDVLPDLGWDASRMRPALRSAPWPDGDPDDLNPPEVIPAERRYNTAYLLWAANPTGGAIVWLPTVAEMEEAERVNSDAIEKRKELAALAHGARPADLNPTVTTERLRINPSTPGEYPRVAEALDKIQLPESFA